MKTITTALIAATLAIVSSTVQSADRFKDYRNARATVPVCVSPDSVVDLLNAQLNHNQVEINAIMRKECVLVPQPNREFEITGESRYVSEIVFYKGQCQLDTQKHYIANTSILSYTPDQIKQINAQLSSMAASNKSMQVTLIEPAICGQPQQDVESETPKLLQAIEPENMIVCSSLELAKELVKSEDGWPKGCFTGKATSQAVLSQTEGQFVEVFFKQADGSLSFAFWSTKDNFK